MFFERPGGGEQAVLVHLEGQNPEAREDPQEFQELVRSAGAETVAFVSVSRHQPSAKYLIGSGKVEELHDLVKAENVELVIFNHTLTPSQERNLERAFECRVLDRTGLILDIFAQRARTHEGKLQVELAQLEHMSTRLVRGWTHLERQKGGIGLRGPGETQLETDRRLLRVRIRQIKQRLEKVRSQREQARRGRKRADIPAVSLVAIPTPANRPVQCAHRLRGVCRQPVVRHPRPHPASPATGRSRAGGAGRHGGLHPPPAAQVGGGLPRYAGRVEQRRPPAARDRRLRAERDAQVEQVLAVLGEIGANELPMLEVYNKVDLLPSVEPHIQRDDSGKPVRVWLSAQTGEGLDLLRQAIAELLGEDLFVGTLRLPQRLGRLRAQLFELGAVQSEAHDEEGCTLLQVRLPRAELNRLASRAGWQPAEFVAQHTLQ